KNVLQPIEITKVRIGVTNKEGTAFRALTLLAAFFEGINLRGILREAILTRESLLDGIGSHGGIVS
ncbi:MAG: hypothetical protein ACLPX5_13125, partial [Dissulfurispiraceae bacterium]